MKKYQNHTRLTRAEQQKITGGFDSNNNTYCFIYVNGRPYATLVGTSSCDPSLCCAVNEAVAYGCGRFPQMTFLEC
jgi:hypothetical protein